MEVSDQVEKEFLKNFHYSICLIIKYVKQKFPPLPLPPAFLVNYLCPINQINYPTVSGVK